MSHTTKVSLERMSQELLIPFQVDSDTGMEVVYFKLICPLCGGTFFKMPPDNKSIRCGNDKCTAVPLVVPMGFAEGKGTWVL